MAFHVENLMQVERGLPFEVRHETAYFDIRLSKEEDRKLLAKAETGDLGNGAVAMVRKAFFMVTCPHTLRSAFVLNFPGRFECFLLDLMQRQIVVNVKTKLSRELMLASLQAEVTDASWTNVDGTNILTLSFSDGAFACIDYDGRPVRVVAGSLFNQSVLGNQEKFWAREHI